MDEASIEQMNGSEVFWELATDFIGENGVEEGTLMGGRVLRAHGEFFAMPEHRGGGLVLKLPAARVSELIGEGAGEPFAPAGKVFKEWVHIPEVDPARWTLLMDEARQFVS